MAQCFRQRLCREFTAGHGGASDDLIAPNGNIGHTDVVSELVLPGVALEEAVKVDVAAMESGLIVPVLESPDADFLAAATHGTGR
jgi:hypothetical protein